MNPQPNIGQSVHDPVVIFPMETCLEVFYNLDHRDIFSASHVSRRWRILLADNYLWIQMARFRDDEMDSLSGACTEKSLRDIFYQKKAPIFYPIAGFKCMSTSFETSFSEESRFKKIVKLTSTGAFMASTIIKQVPPGTYDIYWRMKFSTDAVSNKGFFLRVVIHSAEKHTESLLSNCSFNLTPYGVFIHRTDQWLVIHSHEFKIPYDSGPQDVRLEVYSEVVAISNGITFDYVYIRDVSPCYFNKLQKKEYRDGPIPKRLDMYVAGEEAETLPRISSAF